MDQETRWLTKYKEVVDFVEANHRNPSRHRIEEHDMLNWVKANRKRMNAGEMICLRNCWLLRMRISM